MKRFHRQLIKKSAGGIRPTPPELRERAVHMVAEVRADYESPWAAMNAVAEKLGMGRRRCASGSANLRSTVERDRAPRRESDETRPPPHPADQPGNRAVGRR